MISHIVGYVTGVKGRNLQLGQQDLFLNMFWVIKNTVLQFHKLSMIERKVTNSVLSHKNPCLSKQFSFPTQFLEATKDK